jgi:iron complex outermembrane recepter protein
VTSLPHPRASRNGRQPVVLATLLALALPLPLLAQAAGADEVVVLSPFNVDASQDDRYRASASISATRTSTEIADLPFNIQVFTEEFIEDIAAFGLDDVLEYSAAVVKSGTGSVSADNTSTFSIRGFEAPYVTRNGFRRIWSIDPLTVERVEIVKGPASLLYGQVPPGGVINYITKRPVFTPRYQTRVSAANYGYLRGELDFGGPVGDSRQFAYRVLGAVETREAEARYFKRDSRVLAPSFLWQPSRQTSLLFEFEYAEHDIRAPIGLYPLYDTDRFIGNLRIRDFLPVPRDFNIRGPDARSETTDFNGTLTALHRFNDTFSSRVVAAHGDSRRFTITGGTGLLTQPARTLARTHGASESQPEYVNIQAELLGEFRFARVEWDALLGFEWFERESVDRNWTTPPAVRPAPWRYDDPSTWVPFVNPFPRDYTLSNFSSSDNGGESFFLSNQVRLFEQRLHLLAGVRYDKFDTAGVNLTTGNPNRSFSGDRWSPQAGILFRPVPAVSVFANYSESFVPNFTTLTNRANALARDAAQPFETTTAEPLVGQGVEAGFKVALWQERLSGTVSFFQLENTGIIRNVQERPHPSRTDLASLDYQNQSGTDRSEGVDVEMVASVSRNWQILGSVTFLDAFVKSDQQTPANEGKIQPNAPKRAYALFTNYTFTEGALDGFSLRLGTTYVGDREGIGQAGFYNPLPSYQLWEASVGYRGTWRTHDYRLNLVVKNLTDEFYFPSRFQVGESRRIIGSVTFTF